MTVGGLLLAATIAWFLHGSLEEFPTAEQQETVRVVTAVLAAGLLAVECALVLAWRWLGRADDGRGPGSPPPAGSGGAASPRRATPSHSRMTPDEYLALGRHIWQTQVPPSGQSSTVQGELLRASQKLRDEAHRNGNANWDEGHEILARYIRDTLEAWPGLTPDRKAQLRADIALLTVPDAPYLEDDVFDRVERCILDWCAAHPEPVPRAPDPRLRR